jgi:hypothetical protein
VRTCGACGERFESHPRPFSNSKGKYCSRKCRDAAFLGVVNGDAARPARTERSGWRSHRDRFVLNGNDFCAICGVSSGRLHVHHIEGHRNVAFDDLSTVVTVCPKHHSALEALTARIAVFTPTARRTAALVILGLLGDTRCEHQGRRVLAGAYA